MTANYSPYPPGHEAGPRLTVLDPAPAAGMSIDTIRALFTYSIITFVIIGGMVMLFVRAGQPDPSGLNTVLGGFIGAGLVFLTGQEVQTRTARQAASATAANTAATTAAVAAANSGVGTISNGPPTPNQVADDTAAIARNTADIAENTERQP
jgi:hypothetical protein